MRRLRAGRNMAVPRKVLGLGAAVALLLAVFLLWQWLRHDGDQLVLYGNVDIRQVDLSFRVNGRIASVLVDEAMPLPPVRLWPGLTMIC